MRTNEEMYVYISISGLNLNLKKIEDKIGLKHTSFDLKGSFVEKTKIKFKSDRWEYREKAIKNFNLDNLISRIFKKLNKKISLEEISKFGKIELVCVFKTKERIPNISISNKNLKMMTQLGVSFWVDYYF